MNIDLSRRGFLTLAGAGVAATSLGAMGFGAAEAAELAHVRDFKLVATSETRNTCPYCSVACGVIIYAKPGEDGKRRVTHIEGDADHPTNRGTLCPKGAALKNFVNAENRLTQPMIRKPGAAAFEPITWEDALDRIARAMKDDRDANFLQTNEAGVPVNRWTTAGFLAASATTNETAFLTYKVVRSMGVVGFDNQARV